MKTTMPAHTADYLVAAMLAAVSADDVTPVITGAYLEAEGKALRATATDRYRMHEVTLDAATTTGKGGVILPARALKWIARTLRIVAPRRFDRDMTTVTITTRKDGEHDTRVAVAIDAPNQDRVTLDTLAIRGNYPPIRTLIDKAQKAEPYAGVIALNLGYVGKMDALRPAYAQAAHVVATVGDHRPGVVLVTYEAEGVTAVGIVQPNLRHEQ